MLNRFEKLEVIYQNPLASQADVQGFVTEGEAVTTFPHARLRLENKLDRSVDGQRSNYLFWCPVEFPDCVMYEWDFYPIREPGLAMFFFSAMGQNGESIFSPSLAKREGVYKQYFKSDIRTFHASYFRRNLIATDALYDKHIKNFAEQADSTGFEAAFQTCNLRKSPGIHMAAIGADPIPCVQNALPPYKIKVIKHKEEVLFAINDLLIYHYVDDGVTYGPLFGGGYAGFRQMAPLIAEYGDFRVTKIRKTEA